MTDYAELRAAVAQNCHALLIDDPDTEVFDTVSNRIVSYGRHIIPNLEQLWENTPDETIQEKRRG